MALFLDTNVFLYAAGTPHALREPCRAVLERVAAGTLHAITSAEVVQELLYVLARKGRREDAVRLAASVIDLCPDILPVTGADVRAAGELLKASATLSVRDAVHVATMRNNGLYTLVSADQHFDGVRGIKRLSPEEAAAS